MVRNLSALHIIYELPARHTISDLLENLGQTCSEYQDYAFRNLDFKTVETDEIWSFVGSKKTCQEEKTITPTKSMYGRERRLMLKRSSYPRGALESARWPTATPFPRTSKVVSRTLAFIVGNPALFVFAMTVGR